MNRFILLLFVALFGTVQSETCISTITEQGCTWSTQHSESINLQTDLEGYSISVTIVECDLNGEEGEFVYISSNNPEVPEQSRGLRFSYMVEKNLMYFFKYDTINAELNNSSNSKFTAVFKRVGEPPITTTEAPITSSPFPIPNNVSSQITVYLGNIKYTEFNNSGTLLKFKKAVVQMAEEYCITKNIKLKENITEANILIDWLIRCPSNWKDYENCVKIIFAVPIILKEESEYQLTTENLQMMWDIFAEKYLKGLFTLYEAPNITKLNTDWYLVIGFILVLFVGLLVLCKWIVMRLASSKTSGSLLNNFETNSSVMDPNELCAKEGHNSSGLYTSDVED